MSRGFVKEDDQEELPVIPPRAALPEGVINYVTSNGLNELHAEREELEKQKASIPQEDEAEHRRATMIIQGKLNLLQERIVSARLIQTTDHARDEVRFGATVTYKMPGRSAKVTFQIVGADEANIKKKKIAFVSPISLALIGHRVGDFVEFRLGDEVRQIEVLDIHY